MTEAPHYSAAGARLKEFPLPPEVFDGRVNSAALHRAVVSYLANQRQGTHATKTRGLVSGGNRKPWRQKGTGRARQGSIRAPQWRGGGVVFGPAPRDYRLGLPRKVRRLARKSALNARARESAIHVVQGFPLPAPKTKAIAQLLEKIGVAGEAVLLLTAGPNETVYLSARNLRCVAVRPYEQATAYEILRARHLVIEERALTGQAPEEAVQGEPDASVAEAAPARAGRKAKAAGAKTVKGKKAVAKGAGPSKKAQARSAKKEAKRGRGGKSSGKTKGS